MRGGPKCPRLSDTLCTSLHLPAPAARLSLVSRPPAARCGRHSPELLDAPRRTRLRMPLSSMLALNSPTPPHPHSTRTHTPRSPLPDGHCALCMPLRAHPASAPVGHPLGTARARIQPVPHLSAHTSQVAPLGLRRSASTYQPATLRRHLIISSSHHLAFLLAALLRVDARPRPALAVLSAPIANPPGVAAPAPNTTPPPPPKVGVGVAAG